MSEIKFTPRENLKEKPAETTSFGKNFTDYMFVMDYNPGNGWHSPRIEPYGKFEMDPASAVLHYGQGVFEGLKAYRGDDGRIFLFRPADNLRRMNRSSKRMCIPEFDEELVLEGLQKLISIEKDWIPSDPGTSLYIRPFIISTGVYLGVHPSEEYRLMIILSPVGSYYAEGLKPVSILVEDFFVRAVPGGVGEAKTMGNYAASMLAALEAEKKGYNQVLWLDGVEKKYIEEVGAMNIFFRIGDKIIAPALSGSLLAGITRNSVMKILQSWGIETEERRIAVDELLEAAENGDLKEAFGSGTAAVISPVGKLGYKNKEVFLPEVNEDSVSMKLYNYLTGLQYGREEDPFGWRLEVE